MPRFDGLHADVTDMILRTFYEVYNELGGGFLESVYHSALEVMFQENGVRFVSESPIQVSFHRKTVGSFIADLIVEDKVLLELKAVQVFDRAHESQVLNYLRATNLEVALLLNFGPKPQFKRFLLTNTEKKIRVHPRESVVGFKP